MVTNFIKGLIVLCLLVLCVYIALWVFGILGIVIPATIMPIIWVIVALFALLILIGVFTGRVTWQNWF